MNHPLQTLAWTALIAASTVLADPAPAAGVAPTMPPPPPGGAAGQEQVVLPALPDLPELPRDSAGIGVRVARPRGPTPEPALGEPYRGWRIVKVEFHGLPGDVKGRLAEGLAITGRKRWIVFTKRPTFTPELMATDLERALLHLARQGYPEAAITPEYSTVGGGRRVRIVLRVDAGRRVHLASCHAEGLPSAIESRARRMLEPRRGEPFSDSRIEERARKLRELLRDEGHADATVTSRVTAATAESASIAFDVTAGPVYQLGDVRVEGAPPNLRSTVTRTADIDRGARYSPGELQRAEQSLRGLDLFRRIEVTTAEPAGDTLDVIVRLAERAPRTLEAGLGLWSEDLVRVRAQWKHRNLFGGGRGGAVEAAYSRYLQTGLASLWRPGLFHSRTRGIVTLQLRREDEELYELLSAGIEAAATYLYSERTTIRPSVAVSRIDVRSVVPIDSVFETTPRSLATAALRWTRSALDNPIDPARGIYSWALVEYGVPDFNVALNYLLAEGEAVAYHTLRRRTVLASRLHAGYAAPVSSALGLLPNKRFYSGGAGSMRGYRRHKLGPLDEQQRPVGGLALAEASTELRLPIVDPFQLALFVDAGQVWQQRAGISTNWEAAAGTGLIVRTPIGPARVDVAFLITDPEAGQPRTVYHVTLGHAF